MPVPPPRRLWSVRVDERSKEVGWTIGSKVYRSRLEEGKLGSEFFYDFGTPWNLDKPMTGWSWGLPQLWRGFPHDGKLLRLRCASYELLLEFFYEPSGVPGSLLVELMHNLELIPIEEMNHVRKSKRVDQGALAAQPHPERREGVTV